MAKPRDVSDFFRDYAQNIKRRQQSDSNSSIVSSIDVAEDKLPAATSCPRCGSIECKSNRIPNAGFVNSLGNALSDYRAGRGGLAAKTLAAWSFVEVASILRGKRVCNYCQHTW